MALSHLFYNRNFFFGGGRGVDKLVFYYGNVFFVEDKL